MRNSIYGHVQRVNLHINGRDYYFRSKAEVDYAVYLDLIRRAGVIKDWTYESEKLIFGEGALRQTYTPDFVVINSDSRKEYHEYKGRLTPGNSSKRFRLLKEFYPDYYVVLVMKRIPCKGPQAGTYRSCLRFVDKVLTFNKNGATVEFVK